MIRFLSVFGCILLIAFSSIAVAAKDKPRWTLELNAELFEPRLSRWEETYGSKRMPVVGGSIAYRLLNVLDLGMSVNYGQERGNGYLPLSGLESGKVTHHMLPVELFGLLRLRFTENQWIVPYAGGGYTRFAYYQTIAGQDSNRGSVNGYHARVGLQLLLDPLDIAAENDMKASYGAINSYLFFEVKGTDAVVETVDGNGNAAKHQLGGYSYKSGLMVEFR